MILDEQDKRQGTKFIVGKWTPDYIVNAFSNDLAQIPAGEFKSDDGRDFTSLTFEFFENGELLLSDSSKGVEEKGSWEMTGYGEYSYTFEKFFEIPDSTFKKNAETLSVRDNGLVFSLGFLAVALKKTEDGTVAEQKDIKDAEADPDGNAIVGRYEVAEAFAFLDGDYSMHKKEEVFADLEKRRKEGSLDPDDEKDTKQLFGGVVEFTPDHRVISWMPLPDGVSEDEIKEAVEAGEIAAFKDGMFAMDEGKEWKCVENKYYYDTGEERETFGEKQSPWDELKTDENGLIEFGSGMMKIRKI